MTGRVQHRQAAAGGVGEQVHPFQAEVPAQGLDVVHQAVAAVRRRVGRHLGVTGAPQVEEVQPPAVGETAEVPEVGGGPHGAARQDDERRALPRTWRARRVPSGAVKVGIPRDPPLAGRASAT